MTCHEMSLQLPMRASALIATHPCFQRPPFREPERRTPACPELRASARGFKRYRQPAIPSRRRRPQAVRHPGLGSKGRRIEERSARLRRSGRPGPAPPLAGPASGRLTIAGGQRGDNQLDVVSQGQSVAAPHSAFMVWLSSPISAEYRQARSTNLCRRLHFAQANSYPSTCRLVGTNSSCPDP